MFGSEFVEPNVRSSNLSMCLSASDVDSGQSAEPNGADVNRYNPNFAEFCVDKFLADKMKGKLHLTYNLRKSKLELQYLQQFQAMSASIGLNSNRKPCLSFSSFWGVKDLGLCNVESIGFGGQLQINDVDSWISCSAGLSVCSRWCKLGLTFKQPGLFTATCSSHIGTPSTVPGGYISHSYEEDQTKFAAGVVHSFDPSLYVKSRVGSDLVLSGVVSKSFGNFRVNLVGEVDFKKIQRIPRAGLFFFIPWRHFTGWFGEGVC